LSASLLQNEQLLAQNAQPKALTPGVSQDATPAPASGGGGSSSPFAALTPMLTLAIFIPIFFLMSRRQKKESQARKSLKKGDRVMTNAGIIGELVEIDERVARVKVTPSVTLQFVGNTILPYVESEKSGPKELKDAKAVSEKK
jgi:preprotein translocase subunit YajC